MRNMLIVILMCLANGLAFGQSNKSLDLEYPKELNGDTAFWFKWMTELGRKLNLKPVMASKELFYFRLWTSSQIVEVRTSDYTTFTSMIINFIQLDRLYDPNSRYNKTQKPKMIYIQSLLDSASARKAYGIIKTISTVPTQDSIQNWLGGSDGTEYILEDLTPSRYRFREYWSPDSYSKTIPEAQQILSFIESFGSTLKLEESHKNFFATLPNGNYSIDATGITIFGRGPK